MKNIKNYNLTKIIKKEHAGKWVALSPKYDKVVGFSADLVTLTKKVGGKKVVYMKAMSPDTHYAFVQI